MKTKILIVTLMIGLTTYAMAQTAFPAGISAGQTVPATPAQRNNGLDQITTSPNISQSNGITSGDLITNKMNLVSTNLSNGTNGNNGATFGNGMTNRVNGNPFATYTNPNSIYTNPNSVYVNPNSTNINPNYTKP